MKIFHKVNFSIQTLIMSLVFICLLGIQTYFLVQTYSLEKKEIYENVSLKLSDLNKKVLPFVKDKDTMFLLTIKKYYQKEEDIENVKKQLIVSNADFAKRISQELERIKKENGIDIAYCKAIKQITLFDKNKRKALLKEPLLLFENKALLGEQVLYGSSAWNSEKDLVNSKLHFYCESNDHFSVNNIRFLVFKKLAVLISCSVLLLILVVMLFYKSLNNLKIQKRITNNHQEIINNIAHELKTPLASLTIAIKTLEKMDLNHESKDIVRLIERQKERFSTIVNQINFEEQFSISDAEISELNISKWTEEYLEDKQFEIESIIFQTSIKSNVFFNIRESDWQTILTNLVSNSAKYGANEIQVSLQEFSEKIVVTVSDNGEGVSKNDSDFIFDKFYRAQKGNTYETKGLGLGLYYVLKTLKKYNGTINLKSLATPTVFEISLPK